MKKDEDWELTVRISNMEIIEISCLAKSLEKMSKEELLLVNMNNYWYFEEYCYLVEAEKWAGSLWRVVGSIDGCFFPWYREKMGMIKQGGKMDDIVERG